MNLTITTLNTKLARILEPRAPRPDLRLQALKQVDAGGLERRSDLRAGSAGHHRLSGGAGQIVRATKEAGGHYIYANPLFLKPCSASVFLPFLEKEFPHLVDDYRKRYADNAFVSKVYRQATLGVDGGAAEETWHHERSNRQEAVSTEYRAEEVQLALFG